MKARLIYYRAFEKYEFTEDFENRFFCSKYNDPWSEGRRIFSRMSKKNNVFTQINLDVLRERKKKTNDRKSFFDTFFEIMEKTSFFWPLNLGYNVTKRYKFCN